MADTSTEDRQTKEAEETVQKKTDRQSIDVKKKKRKENNTIQRFWTANCCKARFDRVKACVDVTVYTVT